MKIVIVDNDTPLLRSLKILLASQKHEVTSFADPHDALCFLQKERPVDLLLLDFSMPGLNGDDFLRRSNSNQSEPCSRKIVLITGHLESINEADLRQLGVSELLPKPLDFNRFWELVENMAHS